MPIEMVWMLAGIGFFELGRLCGRMLGAAVATAALRKKAYVWRLEQENAALRLRLEKEEAPIG